MKLRLCLLSAFLVLVASSTRLVLAEEPSLEFLQGLRDRNYFDYALLYLDQVAQRPSLPAEAKPIILYEKAITLRDNSRILRNPEKQTEQLDQALAYLDQFVSEYPDHPSAGNVNFDRAQILLQKASVEITQSKSPANKNNRAEFWHRGRDLVVKARDVLKLAHDQHETALKAFPPFIDEQKEPKLRAEREKVESSLVIEASDLARCTYLEAQTYDQAAREYKQLLAQAAEEFEKIYVQYRKTVGGQLARAWQGKCYEESGDLQKALGIYNEIFEQPEDDAGFQNLKTLTLLFKLICLRERNEDQVAADLAEDWLKKNASESRTTQGLGIQLEHARALESLGDNKDLPQPDRVRYWRQSKGITQNIAKFAGEHKDFATSMEQRLTVKLGDKNRKLDDFNSAYEEGSNAFKEAGDKKKELDAALKSQRSPEDITRLKQDWSIALGDAAKNLELSMRLITRHDKPKDVSDARYFLALTNFYLKRYYEAAILGEYVARTTAEDENSLALDAAHIAMASYQQAYNEIRVEPDKKQDDLALVIKAANFIAERWPDSEKANDAKMTLGEMYNSAKKPSEAAEWYSKIPENDAKFPAAQIAAGRAYWNAYGSSSRLAPELRPSPEKMAEWKDAAERYLRTGIEKFSVTLPKDGTVPGDMVNAKINLAEILLNQGKAADAAKTLLDDPQSIVKAVAVPDESQRPPTGVKSRPAAMAVYKLLLRAYISLGTEKLNDARDTMKTLETIASGDPGSDLTDLYVGLGRALKSELEQFRANGETDRFNKLMEAFELFLDDMFKKQDQQTFGSLSWIGETYATLGEISTDKSKSATFYDRAASAFNRIVSRSQNEASFVTPAQLLNVKFRLVHCNRLKKDFEGAEAMLIEVLKARGNDSRTQFEGAMVYQDWGTYVDRNKFVIANGGKKEIGLWGWTGIAKRIQAQKDFAERSDLIDTFLDARYNITLCRYRYSKDLSPKEKPKALETCLKEMVGLPSILRKMPDEKRAKLNDLYHEILQEAGKPAADLPKYSDAVVDEPPPAKESAEADPDTVPEKTAETEKETKPTEASTPKAEPESNLLTYILILVALVGGGGFIARVLMTSKKAKPRKKSTGEQSEAPLVKPGFTGIATDKSAKGPSPVFSMPSAAPKPRPKPTAAPGSPAAAQRPARPAARPEGGASPSPKPRPKPPAPPPSE